MNKSHTVNKSSTPENLTLHSNHSLIQSVMMVNHRAVFTTLRVIFISIVMLSISILNAESDKKNPEASDQSDSDLLKELKEQKNRLELENEIESEKWEKQTAKIKRKLQAIKLKRASELEDLSYEESKIRAEKVRLDLELTRMKIDLARKEKSLADQKVKADDLAIKLHKREKELDWKSTVNLPIRYAKNPVKDNILHISDRVVHLNGLISYASARSVIERIQFFSNRSSSRPIFLVIDSSPGGSVMAGYQIIKAMQSSRAPVHVLVKTYAASMSATIVSMAEKSYCFPSTIILHHQIRGKNSGNITQQREKLKLAEEWNRRIAGPVAKKMGLTIEQFMKKMYENNSEGDWMEFGDAAVRLKWVDRTVERVIDQSIREKPDVKETGKITIQMVGGKLPALNPFDLYHLYDPDKNFQDSTP